MTDESMDQRYVGFREHAAAQQRLDSELARIRERQATTEATLLHEVSAVRTDVSEVKQLMLRSGNAPAPVDHMALAIQRIADQVDQRGGHSPLLIGLAVAGALASGWVAHILLGT